MKVFGSGPRLEDPKGDPARQAVSALRGYAYQLYASALAWLTLRDGAMLHLEVAEDYADVTHDALRGTQVRDTANTGSITLQSEWARRTIESFVDLVLRNPQRYVSLNYLTTSPIGLERESACQVHGRPALEYWRLAAAGADVTPLRNLIDELDLKDVVKSHLRSLSDENFRQKFLQRIHWHCGAPDMGDMRADLEAGVVEYVASARRLSSKSGRDCVPLLLEAVLRTAVAKSKRSLRRADLLELIDESAMVAVPIEQLANAFGGPPSSAFSRSPLLMPMNDLPLPEIYAPREALLSKINDARLVSGIAITTGATGLGKSFVARLVAEEEPACWSIADFRHLTHKETVSRLESLCGEVAMSSEVNVVLDDINTLDHPQVRDAVARLLVCIRRRDGTSILTTYRSPAETTLSQLAVGVVGPITIPYLDECEVASLIVQMGGEYHYAKAVHRAAANGHPQMTMAALVNLRTADWSRRALTATFGGELHAELGAERRAVRERLVDALPHDAQTLLLRTSLIRGAFDRDLAIKVADLSPAIGHGGLILDQLVGPWIEQYARDRLRVSPMIEDAANDVLSKVECRAIHSCVAETMMKGGEISTGDAQLAMHHALCSNDTELVAMFANAVITCDIEMIDSLAPFLTELIVQPFDRPIFAKSHSVSAMMRLCQLMMLLPNGTVSQAAGCWAALEVERLVVKGETLFEAIVLSKILLHPRTGELFEDWLGLILRFDRLCFQDGKLAEASSNIQFREGKDPHVTGVLFAGQMSNVDTVAKFRNVMERLDEEDDETRRRIFSAFEPGRGDVSVLVNNGWLRELRQEYFDWEAAQRNYRASFHLSMAWGHKVLASRCAIAQAICIDEVGDDAERALAVLSEAEAQIGPDIALSRARAKIHWRRRDHAKALPLLTAAAASSEQDLIERAHVTREAGISAATLGDWNAAYKWFESSEKLARQASDLPAVRSMAIGLLADTAQAAFNAGRPDVSINKMRDALKALPEIDSEGSLEEAHCHRVVRHGLLWLYRAITGADHEDDEIVYSPGAASNPSPLEAIRSHPVVALDMSFYILANADKALAEPTGFFKHFRQHLVVGPVLSSEISAAIADVYDSIGKHDATDFVDRVRRHASMSSMVDSGKGMAAANDLSNPERGTVSLVSIQVGAPKDLYRPAEDYLLSFAAAAAMARAAGAIDSVVSQGLASEEIVGLHPLLSRLNGNVKSITSDREGAANSIWLLRNNLDAQPIEFCWSAMWILLHVSNSRLQEVVAQPVVEWIFARAVHLVDRASFLLVSPTITAPALKAIIASPEYTVSSAAQLLLELAPAVGTRYPPQIHSRLLDIIQKV